MSDQPRVDGGFKRSIGYGLLGIVILVAAVFVTDRFRNHGAVVETNVLDGIIVSSFGGSARAQARYQVRLPDGATKTLVGPGIPMYPSGTSVKVASIRYADGTTEYTFQK